MFSGARQRLHTVCCLLQGTSSYEFPVVATDYMFFFRAWNQSHVVLRLVTDTSFPAQGASRTWLHVFLRLALFALLALSSNWCILFQRLVTGQFNLVWVM